MQDAEMIFRDGVAVQGNRVGAFSRPNRTYPRQRVCSAEACEARLSIYNPADRCWQHEERRRWVLRAPRPRVAA